jgi:Aspartyl protease
MHGCQSREAPAGDFRYSGRGERVPLFFADKTPVIPAVADGVPGGFEIDTGSSTSLVLQRGFVEQHGLEARHPDGLRMKVGGIGGVFETIATRLDRFDLASRVQNRAPRGGISFTRRGRNSGGWHRREHWLPNPTTVRDHVRLLPARNLV